MQLHDLAKSASEMTDEELHARLRDLRISRGATPAIKPRTSAPKAKGPAPITAATLSTIVNGASAEEAAALLELLEGL